MTAFFFSSRRRHTRYWRDWSSDVCSSDLMATATSRSISRWYPKWQSPCSRARESGLRSEERRVGKECRVAVSADDEKNNNEHSMGRAGSLAVVVAAAPADAIALGSKGATD